MASDSDGSQGGVAIKLEIKINPFILSCHCVAHKTNLAILDTFKTPNCKVISDEVDTLSNTIAFF